MKRISLYLLLLFCPLWAAAQHSYSDDSYTRGTQSDIDDPLSWGRDTTSDSSFEVPIGITQWTLDPRLGYVIPAENIDTVTHMFHNFNNTSGYNGEYSFLGTLGSPRIDRIYMNRQFASPIPFMWPYDYSSSGLNGFRFSNTLSPMTNLAYHKVGNRQSGEERLHAYFASNINKIAGIGMKFDYLYGRGYYNSQANSQFCGTLFGYYQGDRYNIHAYANFDHFKMAENGGIEDDAYITNPQSFPRSYGSKDIPTALSETWNRNQHQDYFLTQRFNLGYHKEIELPDSLKPKMPSENELLAQLSDSIRLVLANDSVQRTVALDSLRLAWENSQIKPQEFIPVASIVHTFSLNNLHHTYYSHNTPENYYTNLFYGTLTNVKDLTKALVMRNTFALSLNEGFKKWAQFGLSAFVIQEHKHYTLPDLQSGDFCRRAYKENNILVGGEMSRTKGDWVHYNVNGEISILGESLGDFNIEGTLDLDIPISKRDTLQLSAHGFIQNLDPDFYFCHYHSQFNWWDNDDLSKEFKTRIEGRLHVPRTGTTISVGLENLKHYTYLTMQNTLIGTDATSVLSGDYSHDVAVRQVSSNIQVFSATLKQDLAFGPFHFDNEFTYQSTSNSRALPLPKFNLYSNLYFKFRLFKVLNVELGGDVRYYTSFYAPDYAPSIGMYATQDASQPRVKIGNYPIVCAYVNLHLKRCRLYVLGNHLNAGSGRMFWAPHYPINPRNIYFGLSWNFFN